MSAPRRVLDAIAMVSPVVCAVRCGPVEVTYDELRDCPVIAHPFADCPHAACPDNPAAVALAESVTDELARHIVLADYGERVLHVWAAA